MAVEQATLASEGTLELRIVLIEGLGYLIFVRDGFTLQLKGCADLYLWP